MQWSTYLVRPVNIVEIVESGIDLIDLLSKGFGIEVSLSILSGKKVIERKVEDMNDLTGLVVHCCKLYS